MQILAFHRQDIASGYLASSSDELPEDSINVHGETRNKTDRIERKFDRGQSVWLVNVTFGITICTSGDYTLHLTSGNNGLEARI